MLPHTSRAAAAAASAVPDFHIVEGVSGVYFYHLARGTALRPLCDPKYLVMRTSIPLSGWGVRSHLQEKYCTQCESLARREGVVGLGERHSV